LIWNLLLARPQEILDGNFVFVRRTLMRRVLFSLLLLVLAASVVQADQVTLSNGDRLSGKIVTGDGKTLLLKTDFAGDVTIQWNSITGIESTDTVYLTLKDGTKFVGKVTTRDGKFVVASATPATTASAPVATKDTVVAVRDDEAQKAFDLEADHLAHPKFNYFWSGLFDTGLALTRGNSSTTTFTVASKAVRETPKDKLTLYGNYVFGRDGTTPPSHTTANQLIAGVRGDYNISPRVFVFALADFQTNELQNLDLRQTYGGGLGYHVIKTDNTTFDVFGGVTYERDAFGAYSLVGPPIEFVPSSEMNSMTALVGEEFDAQLNKKTKFAERLALYPSLTNAGNFRSQFDTSLVTQFKAWLSWQITFSDSYINFPPPGLKENDLLLSTGLRVTWGKAKI
jgi:putative salt-induced outer membrane protein